MRAKRAPHAANGQPFPSLGQNSRAKAHVCNCPSMPTKKNCNADPAVSANNHVISSSNQQAPNRPLCAVFPYENYVSLKLSVTAMRAAVRLAPGSAQISQQKQVAILKHQKATNDRQKGVAAANSCWVAPVAMFNFSYIHYNTHNPPSCAAHLLPRPPRPRPPPLVPLTPWRPHPPSPITSPPPHTYT
jgi:hypothetical protein